MEKLRNLQEVRDAYHQASFWRLIRAAYGVNVTWLRLALWAFSLSSITFCILFAFKKGNVFQALTTFSFFIFVILVTKSIRIIFSNYYSEFPDLLESYKKNKLFLRYLIFKSNLQCSLIGNKSEIEEIESLLEIEKQLNENTIFTKHPVTVTCLGFMTAILGGAASQLSNWSSGLMFIVLFILIIIIFFNYQITEIFQTKSYKDKELRQFLKWLSIEKNESNNLINRTKNTSVQI